MKKTIYTLLAAAVLVSCAKEVSTGKSDLAKKALDEYMTKYHPTAVKTAMGAYIYPENEVAGTGASLEDSLYIRIHYTIMDRDGNISSSTLESLNRQMETWSKNNYYGPRIAYRGDDNLTSGLEEILLGNGTAFGPMKVGGTRRGFIPGWLSGTVRYDSEAEYVANVSGTESVYEITLVEAFDDEETWEKDSLARYVAANLPGAVEDESITGINGTGGWYYLRTGDPISEDGFTSDSTVYCNYTLSRLDGVVLDTSIEQVAKDNDIWSSSATYEPKLINWDEDYSKITMTSSETDVVDGFANAFLHMHQYESGTVVFWSYFGYYATGSGNIIPAYCPLRFDIEIVEEP